VCAGITCAGHGSCVAFKGTPTCACAEGYMPDTVNGLNCLPLKPAAIAPVDKKSPAPGPPLSEEARVERALGGRSLRLEYELYQSEAAGQISFTEYMWNDLQRRKKGFAACAVIGGLSIAGGIVLYFSSMFNVLDGGEHEFLAMLFSGIGSAAVGGVLLGVGIHGARQSKREAEKLDALLFEERNGRPLARRWLLTPFATANGGGMALALEI
jgi:hypothetical protein